MTNTTTRTTAMSPLMCAPYGTEFDSPEAEAYHKKMNAPVNFSEVCTCVTVDDNLSVCTYCAVEEIEVSINNMPEDVSMITTPQLVNLANDAYVGRMSPRKQLSEAMHDIRLECLDEIARRHNRCK